MSQSFSVVRFVSITIALITIWIGALYAAQFVASDESAQALIQQFGYFGILILAFIAGINIILPVPAATFVPIFTAAGLTMSLIITMLVIGTVLADLFGFLVGRLGREAIEEKYPKTFAFIYSFVAKHNLYVAPFAFLFVSFVPFPNEAMIVPLALAGIKIRTLIIPIILGNIVHQSVLAVGFTEIANFFSLL